MTAEQAQAFLKASDGTPLHGMWVVMLYLGLRPGEASGLSRADVDAKASVIHVRRSLKRGVGGQLFIGKRASGEEPPHGTEVRYKWRRDPSRCDDCRTAANAGRSARHRARVRSGTQSRRSPRPGAPADAGPRDCATELR
jgi:integrase